MDRPKLLTYGVIIILIVLIVYAAFNYLPNFFDGQIDDNMGTPQLSDAVEQTFEVQRMRTSCNNGFNGECLVVNGVPFLQNIEDFNHQSGCLYTLRVQRYVAFDPDNAPIETSIYRYRLLEILARTCQPPPAANR